MNFQQEFDFFSDVMKKSNVHTRLLSLFDKTEAMIDSQLSEIIGYTPKNNLSIKDVIGNIDDKTKYVLTNEFGLCYICLRIPVSSEKNILFAGPYLASAISSKEIMEAGERAGLSPSALKNFKEYCASVPVIQENDRLFSVVDTFCEHIWQTHSFGIVNKSRSYSLPAFALEGTPKGDSPDESLANVKMMEMRYAFENELIKAVSLGQQHKGDTLKSVFNEQMFEKRIQDSLRNAKNYCIIMNTLLRKAAEQGGVHPIYIDRLSSKHALKIEALYDTAEVPELMREMFTSYCRLVYKHSNEKYSPVVKKAVLVIDSDVSAELSLSTLARIQGLSPGYLATVFKRETGKTVLEYIRDKRIEHAAYLLGTTHLQIQTVALHCGIMDVQYFSKLFKRQTGKSPKEYRDSIRS